MYDKWCKVLDTVPEREQKLADEMARQQSNEQLRVAFAEKANALSEYITQRQTELTEQSMKALGTMEVLPLSLPPSLSPSLPPSLSLQLHPPLHPLSLSLSQDQLQALVAFEAETLTKQPEMDGAEEIHRQTQAALIFDNKHSTVSMEVCVCERARERGREGYLMLSVLLYAGTACQLDGTPAGHPEGQERDGEPDPHPRLKGTVGGPDQGVPPVL